MTTGTNSVVAQAATQADVFSYDNIALIGTFSGPSGNVAVVRMTDGHIQKLAVGDQTIYGQVTQITEQQVLFTANGQLSGIQMPN